MEMVYHVPFSTKLRYVTHSIAIGLMAVVPIPQFRIAVLRALGAKIGKNVLISPVQYFDYWYAGFTHLDIGDDCHIATGTLLDVREKIILEKHVTIAERCVVLTHSNVGDDNHPLKKEFPFVLGAVHVKEGSFIGAGSIVFPGVTIGPHSCVMAGSVVSRNVPPNVLAGGNPLRILRKLT